MKKISKTDWARIDAMTDDEIDYTDSPEVTEEMFALMTKREPEKVKVNLNLNREIVDFFKSQGSKYQTRINDVLLALVHKYKRHNHSIR
ncbi:MAG: BrnA antitoxin family protein [Gammaproteobacteria bacterium]|nr:BrnA antitoxin family protein [Gammaproteobacteria bacterium]